MVAIATISSASRRRTSTPLMAATSRSNVANVNSRRYATTNAVTNNPSTAMTATSDRADAKHVAEQHGVERAAERARP